MNRIFIISFLLISHVSFGQAPDYKGSKLSIGLSYLELKDEFNYGIVFRGPDIRTSYEYESVDSSNHFNYTFSLGGGGKTAKGTWAGTWYLSPISTHYLWRLGNAENRFYLGPSFIAQYNIQNYPELHAGPIFWMTSYELGFQFSCFLATNGKLIELSLQNSLVSLTSRPSEERDPYYFTTSIVENFSDLHSDLTVSSFNKYIQTQLTASLHLKGKKRKKAISYSFNFLNYNESPNFTQLFHQFRYTWFFNQDIK